MLNMKMRNKLFAATMLATLIPSLAFAETSQNIVKPLSTSTYGAVTGMLYQCNPARMGKAMTSALSDFKMANYGSSQAKSLQLAEGFSYCVEKGKFPISDVGGSIGTLLALSAVSSYNEGPTIVLPETKVIAEYSKIMLAKYSPKDTGIINTLHKDGLIK